MRLRLHTILVLLAGLVLWIWAAHRTPPAPADEATSESATDDARENAAPRATPLENGTASAPRREITNTEPAAAASTTVVRARVIDAETSTPRSGVVVTSVVEAPASSSEPDFAFESHRSNADGRVEISGLVGRHVRIHALDSTGSIVCARRRELVVYGMPELTLALPKPLEINTDVPFFLRVVDAESDRPIAKAKVEERSYHPRIWNTDDNGLAACRGRAGLLMQFLVTAEGYGLQRVDVVRGHDTAEDALVIELRASAELRIRVVGADGRPLVHETFELAAAAQRLQQPARPPARFYTPGDSETWTATSDDEGWARFEAVTARVAFDLAQARSRLVDLDSDAEPHTWEAPEKIVLQPGEHRAMEWKIAPTCTISGRVLDVHGIPVAGADVWCHRAYSREPVVFARPGPPDYASNIRFPDPPESTTETQSGADGSFTFVDVEPGLVQVGVVPHRVDLFALTIELPSDSKPQFVAVDVDSTVDVARLLDIAPGTTRVATELRGQPARHISGRLLDPSGDPVTKAWVRAVNLETRLELDARCTTDGSFRLGPLPLGEYELRCDYHDTFGPSDTARVPAGSRAVDLHLTIASVVSGSVFDENGCLASGSVSLTAVERGVVSSIYCWNEPGKFVFRAVAPGTYVATAVTSDGRVGRTGPFEVKAGASVEGLVLHVVRGGLLGVRHDSNGAADVTILQGGTLLHDERLQRGEQCDFDVPSGTVLVRCKLEGRTLDRTVTIEPAQSTEIVFDSDRD